MRSKPGWSVISWGFTIKYTVRDLQQKWVLQRYSVFYTYSLVLAILKWPWTGETIFSAQYNGTVWQTSREEWDSTDETSWSHPAALVEMFCKACTKCRAEQTIPFKYPFLTLLVSIRWSVLRARIAGWKSPLYAVRLAFHPLVANACSSFQHTFLTKHVAFLYWNDFAFWQTERRLTSICRLWGIGLQSTMLRPRWQRTKRTSSGFLICFYWLKQSFSWWNVYRWTVFFTSTLGTVWSLSSTHVSYDLILLKKFDSRLLS